MVTTGFLTSNPFILFQIFTVSKKAKIAK